MFIHVDDGFGIVKGRENAVRASNEVRRDLARYGLLASEEKSEWGARRNVIWTGFVWDTVNFKLWVTEEKLCRTETLLEELWNKRNENVRVKEIARVAGVIGSFTLAMGNVARFHTRGMLTQVAEMSEKFGWKSSGRMEKRVLDEISFWVKNLRSLNGWRMRGSEEVVYCKAGVVDMFSDASDFQLAGAKFEDEQVCWDTRFKVSLTEGEKGLSSTYRELRAIEEGLRAHGRSLKGKTVRWGCDN